MGFDDIIFPMIGIESVGGITVVNGFVQLGQQ